MSDDMKKLYYIIRLFIPVLVACLIVFCTGCKFGNVNQGDMPLVPVWHHTNP